MRCGRCEGWTPVVTELVVEAVGGLLIAVLGALPDLTLPVGDHMDDFAAAIGGALGGLDGILPISELSEVAAWVLVTYVPVVFAYNSARWVYTHLPVIGNGG